MTRLVSYTKAWAEILDASGLEDLACEEHGHDLLDGITNVKDAYGAPLDEVFRILCGRDGVRDWSDVEQILARMRTVEGFEDLRIPDRHLDAMAEVEHCGLKVGICDHTSVARGTYSDAWITPQWVLGIVRGLYGNIGYDLASSLEGNTHVKAIVYWDISKPCPRRPRAPGKNSVVWCNPPGPCSRVKEFWQSWKHCIAQGARGAFLIFKQDHWRQLPPPSMDVTALVLRRRIRFVGAKGGANFPSTLILSGDQLEHEGLYGHGHVILWRGRHE